MKALPERMCAVCRGKCEKPTLLRLVWSVDKVVLDRLHRLPGRGAYLHPSWDCWSRLSDVGRWAKALRVEDKRTLPTSLQDVFREIRDMLDPEDLCSKRAKGSGKSNYGLKVPKRHS